MEPDAKNSPNGWNSMAVQLDLCPVSPRTTTLQEQHQAFYKLIITQFQFVIKADDPHVPIFKQVKFKRIGVSEYLIQHCSLCLTSFYQDAIII